MEERKEVKEKDGGIDKDGAAVAASASSLGDPSATLCFHIQASQTHLQ